MKEEEEDKTLRPVAEGPRTARLVAKPRLIDRWVGWNLASDDSYRFSTANLDDNRSKSNHPVFFLPTERPELHTMSKLWDEVQLTDDEALIPAALRFLDPNVEKVGQRGEGENLHFCGSVKRRQGTAAARFSWAMVCGICWLWRFTSFHRRTDIC